MCAAAADPTGPIPRAAMGIVAPFDLELDAELWRWLPERTDILMTRTPYVEGGVTSEFAAAVSSLADVAAGVRAVTAGRARTVAYACTSGSFVGGRSGEAALRDAMAAAGAIDPVTTSGAIVEALAALGVHRVAVATPYLPELSRRLDSFLQAHDVSVAAHVALGLERNIWEVSYRQTAELIRQIDRPDAEAIVLSCTNLPSYDLIAPLEAELGKPIISANQATMWASLRRMGRSCVGPGQSLIAVTV